MAIPKVCGIETEYGILVRGGDNNPVSASSLLINAYLNAHTRSRLGRVGWDFEDERPGERRARVQPRRRARPRHRDAPGERGAHQRRPLLRRPRPPRGQHARVPRRGRGRGVRPRRRRDRARQHGGGSPAAARRRRDPVPQEQLRRQGQQLRLSRELPAVARHAVRTHRAPGHPALRLAPDRGRRRQGGLRAPRGAPPTTSRTRSASAPTSSKRRSASRPR